MLNPATQSFAYDPVDRLTSYAGQSASYDAAGNLQARAGTSYSYQTGSHRMTSAGSTGYGYDANGNVTSITGGTTRTITPTAFNLPSTIVQGTTSLAYVYDGGHKRIKETSTTAAGTTTTWYLGSYEEITRTDGVTERRHWIQTPDGPAGIYTSRSDGTTAPRYWLTDHLGSVVGEVDQAGVLKQSASFGAWGDRTQVVQADPRAEDRGYTGHEHLTEVNLVHMNGRVYDPVTGRFLAADPLIQDPLDAQSYNRYSYVKNNPLSFTDPSGYSWWTKWRKPIAAIAVAWALGPGSYSMLSMLEITQAGVVGLATGSAGALTSAASAAAAGFAAGGIQGGNMQSAVTGAVVASLSFGIGEATQHGFTLAEMGSEKFVANVAGHAALGCAQQSLAGGNCGAGAAAAGFSAVAGPLAQPTGLGVIAHAAIGAVASKLAGGKAEDGAVTAAFAYLFNEVGSTGQRGYEPTHYDDGTVCNAASGGCANWSGRAESVAPELYLVGATGLLQSTLGILRGTASASAGEIVGYFGYDSVGTIRYVGITNSPAIRFVDHLAAAGSGRELLNYSVAEGAAFATRLEARIWEQSQILQLGLQKYGGQLLNLRNEIAGKYWPRYGLGP